MFQVTPELISSYFETIQEDMGVNAVAIGERVTGLGQRNSHGLRKYLLVRNDDSSAWAIGNIVRQQCVNPAGTEGTPDAGEATSTTKIVVNAAHGEDTTQGGGGWKLWSSAGEEADVVAQATGSFTVASAMGTAVSDSYTYGVYRPYNMVKCTKNTVLAPAGVAMSAIPAGYYGWIQVYGFGLAKAENTTNSIALAHGCPLEVSTGSDGCVMGGIGADEDWHFGISLITSTSKSALLVPVFLNTIFNW